ncbi:MAG: fumarate hydratase [Chloroflexota bacterium]
MREVSTRQITATVARLCQEANFYLGEEELHALQEAERKEASPLGKEALRSIIENARLAAAECLPLCQDTGVTAIFIELGQEVHVHGNLEKAVNNGVRQGYKKGYLRQSMVAHPFTRRLNTGDNTPAVIHIETVPGDKLKLTVLPKGSGSENMSQLKMLSPGDGRQGIIDFVIQTVSQAGSNPCPPIIVGLGIGGPAEKAMLIAKKTLLRPLGQPHPDAEVAELEKELLARINALGIGPEGFGGTITALAVHAEVFPCHIASLPVAVNIQCHSARHKEAVL